MLWKKIGFALVISGFCLGGTPASSRLWAQEPLAPIPMMDREEALRPLRLKQRDAWKDVVAELNTADATLAQQLLQAWARARQFDVEFFWLVDDDNPAELAAFEKDCREAIKSAVAKAESDQLAKLLAAELQSGVDDVTAIRLTDQGESSAAEFKKFQRARAEQLQLRGKLAAALYRAGQIDAIRLTVALLERQVAERVLFESIHGKMADEPTQRHELLQRQGDEWTTLKVIVAELKTPESAAGIGGRLCSLEQQSVERRLAILELKGGDKSELQKSNVARLASVRDGFRAAVKQQGEGKLTLVQLARIDDLRNYDPVFHSPEVPAAEVLALSHEVVETWTKLHAHLKKQGDGKKLEAAIALAKKLDAEVQLAERQ